MAAKKNEVIVEPSVDMSPSQTELFSDVLPDAEQQSYKNRGTKRNPKPYISGLGNSVRAILNSTFRGTKDGITATVSDYIAMKMVAFTVANPSPQNVKILTEITGEAVVNVKVENTTAVDGFFKAVAPDQPEVLKS